MYTITDSQVANLEHIINHLTVTGPEQGGMLNIAAGILKTVRQSKKKEERTE